MKHTKKFLALVLSLAVVASLAAAGTMAWLSSTTGVITNNFATGTETDGKVEITLDETNATEATKENSNTNRIQAGSGNTYSNLTPGVTLVKDPTVHVDEKSEESFVFVAVKNGFGADVVKFNKDAANYAAANTLDDELAAKGWTKVGTSTDGDVYKYNTTVSGKSEDRDLLVFDGLKINPALGNDNFKSAVNGKTIIVKAYAIQKANLTEADIVEAIPFAEFGKDQNVTIIPVASSTPETPAA